MEAFHGIVGADKAAFDKTAEAFGGVFSVEPETYASDLFSLESYNDTNYYPLKSILRDDQRRLVVLLNGYLWHGNVEADDIEGLKKHVWDFARGLTQRNFVAPPEFSGVYNLIVFDVEAGILYVTPDSSGLFPLYFSRLGRNLVFASHLHLLARSIGVSLDDLGVLETATLKYTIGERTLYDAVYRLQAGHTLVFDLKKQMVERVNHQEFFQSIRHDEDVNELAEETWLTLVKACELVGKGSQPIGVMLSGGLDSRMVIAGMDAADINTIACTHGQEGFHEVDVSRKVARTARSDHHFIALQSDSYIGTAPELESLFWASDNTIFPVWRLGGELLKRKGATALTSGYCLDATLGGHFHDPANPRRRLTRRLRHSIRTPDRNGCIDLYRESYLQGQIGKLGLRAEMILRNQEHLLCGEFYKHLLSLIPQLTEDLSRETERLRESGTSNPAKIWERLVSENHARKYSFGQELVTRTQLPVVVPSYDRHLISLLSSLAPFLTVDHSLYFRVMRKCVREYAAISWSSTALPITYPTIVLELSRAARNRYDRWAKRKLVLSAGANRKARFGAMDFEVVARQSGNLESLQHLLAGTVSHIINKDGIEQYINQIREYKQKAFNLSELTNLVSIKLAEQHQ